MKPSTIDPTRQGGEDTGPKRAQKAQPMTVDEALSYHDGILWRTFQPRGDRAVIALAGEVERLQAEMADDRELAQRQRIAWAGAHRDVAAELARYHAALPGIIGCAHGEATTCDRDPYGWGPCCATRRRCVEAGLLPVVERVNEEEGA